MTNTARHTRPGHSMLALVLALSLPAVAVAAPDRGDRGPQARTGNRLVRTGRVAMHRLTRPLRPQRDFHLNWKPAAQKEFDIVDLVKGFQAQVPARVQKKLASASPSRLARSHSVSYTQTVDDGLGAGPRKAAVHITRGTVDMPLGAFLTKMPADQWGVKLDHYLGGQVKVTKRDSHGRPQEQVERMVLSGLPGNLNIRGLNLDMSKVEKKVVERDPAGNIKQVTMYWRVHDSANKTTHMDVGSVSFAASGTSQTLVTFHSAHRLGLGKLRFPNTLVKPTLRNFFSDHIKHYRELVAGQ